MNLKLDCTNQFVLVSKMHVRVCCSKIEATALARRSSLLQGNRVPSSSTVGTHQIPFIVVGKP